MASGRYAFVDHLLHQVAEESVDGGGEMADVGA
jgi:hypothetical protein